MFIASASIIPFLSFILSYLRFGGLSCMTSLDSVLLGLTELDLPEVVKEINIHSVRTSDLSLLL